MSKAASAARTLALIALFVTLVFMARTVGAQESHPLAGRWKMASVTPEGDKIPWNLTITYAAGKYSATLGSDQGESPAKDFKVDGDTVTFTSAYEGEDYEIKLHLDGDKLSGTWSGGGDSGTATGARAS